jgi:hypothetical protein
MLGQHLPARVKPNKQKQNAPYGGLQFTILPYMKKNIRLLAKAAETSKIGFAGIFADVFCIVFSLIYTLICYANKRE